MHQWIDYSLQTDEAKKIWKEILANPIKAHKKYRAENPFVMNALLSRFKHVFGVTPKALRDELTDEAERLKPLATYLMLLYAEADKDEITKTLSINLDELNAIEDDKSLPRHFSNEIEDYFKYEIDSFLSNCYGNIALWDSVNIGLVGCCAPQQHINIS